MTPPERVWEVMDSFAAHGLPLRVTEYDLSTEDDGFHARYLDDFLTACFAHPASTGFLMWGFWEKAHWRPRAAMFRSDWSPRPAVEVWKRRVYGDWWTRGNLVVDAQGEGALRVFQGRHRVRARAPDGRTIDTEVEVGAEGARVELRFGGRGTR